MLDGPAGTLSYYKEKDARSMFEEMDADDSGYLDMQEVEQLCKQLGKKLSKKEQKALEDAEFEKLMAGLSTDKKEETKEEKK